jgi:hypothetical protein
MSTVDRHASTSPSTITWRSPVQSRSVAKQTPPWSRISTMRPATATISPVRVSGGSASCRIVTATVLSVRGKLAGYGSPPASTSRSRLPSRMRACSQRSGSSSTVLSSPAASARAAAPATGGTDAGAARRTRGRSRGSATHVYRGVHCGW